MRRKARIVKIGNVKIGGNNPISVQGMCKTKTRNTEETIKQILGMEQEGCEIVRVAVPDIESVNALKKIKKQINIPLVADIHFDYKLGIRALKHADKIRINPGNLADDKIKILAKHARDCDKAIRIGVNLGSLDKKISSKYGFTAEAMVESALHAVKLLESSDFYNTIISLKANDILTTVNAYKLIADKNDYPLHIGVTATGTLIQGIVKSSIGIADLLRQGIGDTVRVSLASNPYDEIEAAYEILRALGLRNYGVEYIICPGCGRTEINLADLIEKVKMKVKQIGIKKPIKIAVMGCAVNGPDEAKHADIGVAGSGNKLSIFKNGKIIKTASEKEALGILFKEIENL